MGNIAASACASALRVAGLTVRATPPSSAISPPVSTPGSVTSHASDPFAFSASTFPAASVSPSTRAVIFRFPPSVSVAALAPVCVRAVNSSVHGLPTSTLALPRRSRIAAAAIVPPVRSGSDSSTTVTDTPSTASAARNPAGSTTGSVLGTEGGAGVAGAVARSTFVEPSARRTTVACPDTTTRPASRQFVARPSSPRSTRASSTATSPPSGSTSRRRSTRCEPNHDSETCPISTRPAIAPDAARSTRARTIGPAIIGPTASRTTTSAATTIRTRTTRLRRRGLPAPPPLPLPVAPLDPAPAVAFAMAPHPPRSNPVKGYRPDPRPAARDDPQRPGVVRNRRGVIRSTRLALAHEHRCCRRSEGTRGSGLSVPALNATGRPPWRSATLRGRSAPGGRRSSPARAPCPCPGRVRRSSLRRTGTALP